MYLADLSHVFGHKVDWGNIPSAFGSLLSGASVTLALYIILRDRRAAEREQARRITLVWRKPDLELETGEFVVFNPSDRAITALRLFVRMASPPSYDRLE